MVDYKYDDGKMDEVCELGEVVVRNEKYIEVVISGRVVKCVKKMGGVWYVKIGKIVDRSEGKKSKWWLKNKMGSKKYGGVVNE